MARIINNAYEQCRAPKKIKLVDLFAEKTKHAPGNKSYWVKRLFSHDKESTETTGTKKRRISAFTSMNTPVVSTSKNKHNIPPELVRIILEYALAEDIVKSIIPIPHKTIHIALKILCKQETHLRDITKTAVYLASPILQYLPTIAPSSDDVYKHYDMLMIRRSYDYDDIELLHHLWNNIPHSNLRRDAYSIHARCYLQNKMWSTLHIVWRRFSAFMDPLQLLSDPTTVLTCASQYKWAQEHTMLSKWDWKQYEAFIMHGELSLVQHLFEHDTAFRKELLLYDFRMRNVLKKMTSRNSEKQYDKIIYIWEKCDDKTKRSSCHHMYNYANMSFCASISFTIDALKDDNIKLAQYFYSFVGARKIETNEKELLGMLDACCSWNDNLTAIHVSMAEWVLETKITEYKKIKTNAMRIQLCLKIPIMANIIAKCGKSILVSHRFMALFQKYIDLPHYFSRYAKFSAASWRLYFSDKVIETHNSHFIKTIIGLLPIPLKPDERTIAELYKLHKYACIHTLHDANILQSADRDKMNHLLATQCPDELIRHHCYIPCNSPFVSLEMLNKSVNNDISPMTFQYLCNHIEFNANIDNSKQYTQPPTRMSERQRQKNKKRAASSTLSTTDEKHDIVTNDDFWRLAHRLFLSRYPCNAFIFLRTCVGRIPWVTDASPTMFADHKFTHRPGQGYPVRAQSTLPHRIRLDSDTKYETFVSEITYIWNIWDALNLYYGDEERSDRFTIFHKFLVEYYYTHRLPAYIHSLQTLKKYRNKRRKISLSISELTPNIMLSKSKCWAYFVPPAVQREMITLNNHAFLFYLFEYYHFKPSAEHFTIAYEPSVSKEMILTLLGFCVITKHLPCLSHKEHMEEMVKYIRVTFPDLTFIYDDDVVTPNQRYIRVVDYAPVVTDDVHSTPQEHHKSITMDESFMESDLSSPCQYTPDNTLSIDDSDVDENDNNTTKKIIARLETFFEESYFTVD